MELRWWWKCGAFPGWGEIVLILLSFFLAFFLVG